MGLFGKPRNPAPPKAPDHQPGTPMAPSGPRSATTPESTTIVARGGTIEGRIAGEAGVRVEGRVNGEIASSGTVLVASEGDVRGDVHGRVVAIAGSVEGNISAVERVELASGGNLVGDITAPRVHIAEGAVFEGQVFMRSREDRSSQTGDGGASAGPKTGSARQGRDGKKAGRRS